MFLEVRAAFLNNILYKYCPNLALGVCCIISWVIVILCKSHISHLFVIYVNYASYKTYEYVTSSGSIKAYECYVKYFLKF